MEIESEAVVVGLEEAYALLEVQDRQVGCGRCHEPGGCGGTLLSQMRPQKEKHYRVLNTIQASLGDRVIVVIPAGGLWRASFAAYLLPLFGLLVGAILVSHGSAGDDQRAVVGGVLGLLAGVLVLKIVERQWAGGILMQMRFKRDNECLNQRVKQP